MVPAKIPPSGSSLFGIFPYIHISQAPQGLHVQKRMYVSTLSPTPSTQAYSSFFPHLLKPDICKTLLPLSPPHVIWKQVLAFLHLSHWKWSTSPVPSPKSYQPTVISSSHFCSSPLTDSLGYSFPTSASVIMALLCRESKPNLWFTGAAWSIWHPHPPFISFYSSFCL